MLITFLTHTHTHIVLVLKQSTYFNQWTSSSAHIQLIRVCECGYHRQSRHICNVLEFLGDGGDLLHSILVSSKVAFKRFVFLHEGLKRMNIKLVQVGISRTRVSLSAQNPPPHTVQTTNRGDTSSIKPSRASKCDLSDHKNAGKPRIRYTIFFWMLVSSTLFCI